MLKHFRDHLFNKMELWDVKYVFIESDENRSTFVIQSTPMVTKLLLKFTYFIALPNPHRFKNLTS